MKEGDVEEYQWSSQYELKNQYSCISSQLNYPEFGEHAFSLLNHLWVRLCGLPGLFTPRSGLRNFCMGCKEPVQETPIVMVNGSSSVNGFYVCRFILRIKVYTEVVRMRILKWKTCKDAHTTIPTHIKTHTHMHTHTHTHTHTPVSYTHLTLPTS